MEKAYQIRIKGKVQGVAFRQAAQLEARRMGLRGFARNDADGTVYIEIEGDEVDIMRFIDWCGSGPIYADVSQVTPTESTPQHYHDFKVE